jgi:hypothetical protein
MAPTPYTYTYPGADFPALVTASPNGTVLRNSILYDPAITIALDQLDIGIVPGDCVFTFVDPLPAPDEAALDAICAAHTGIRVLTSMESSSPVVVGTVVVTENAAWQDIAEIVTTPSFFTEDLATLFGRIVGEYKAVAGGGGELPQIQVCEKVAGEANEDKINPPADMAAAADWTTFGVSTDVPVRDGYHNTYVFQARLNDAASFELKWTTMSMILAQVIS